MSSIDNGPGVSVEVNHDLLKRLKKQQADQKIDKIAESFGKNTMEVTISCNRLVCSTLQHIGANFGQADLKTREESIQCLADIEADCARSNARNLSKSVVNSAQLVKTVVHHSIDTSFKKK